MQQQQSMLLWMVASNQRCNDEKGYDAYCSFPDAAMHSPDDATAKQKD
jgi:hypothetical protein